MDSTATEPAASEPSLETPSGKARQIKLIVWDLDNTLWDGTLLEGDDIQPRPEVVATIEALDQRGILHSIASKNDPEAALAALRRFELERYFLYPQIGWSAKSASVKTVVETINIGFDAVAFIDDQPFERDEVSHVLPDVLTLDASEAAGLGERSEFIPRFLTDESAIRRRMYQADAERNQAQEGFTGPTEEFLADLKMKFHLGPAKEEDLKRAEELTVRTNQLNSTGVTYSYEELAELRRSPDHLLIVASLDDRYGTYGKIGLALVEKGSEVWTLRLLLMSCRVISRGVGTILLSHLLNLAKKAGARFLGEFKSTDRNRMMQITFRFAGFREIERRGEIAVYENDLDSIQPFPDYVEIVVED